MEEGDNSLNALVYRNIPKQNKAASLSWLHVSSCLDTMKPDSLTLTEKTPPDPDDPEPKKSVLTMTPAVCMHVQEEDEKPQWFD